MERHTLNHSLEQLPLPALISTYSLPLPGSPKFRLQARLGIEIQGRLCFSFLFADFRNKLWTKSKSRPRFLEHR
jgi:hypothetical protein